MRILQPYQVEVAILIQYQILATNLQGNVKSQLGELAIRSWELKG